MTSRPLSAKLCPLAQTSSYATYRLEKELCSCASISILGVQTFVRAAKPPAAPRGDVIGAINPLKHLAPLVPSVLLDILQQVLKWLSSQLT